MARLRMVFYHLEYKHICCCSVAAELQVATTTLTGTQDIYKGHNMISMWKIMAQIDLAAVTHRRLPAATP